MTTDRIELRGLRVWGRHGVLDSERRDGQEFLIDAVLGVDIRPAAAADDLSQTVDYATLSERLASIVAGEPVRLIETLAERLARACLAEPAVRQVELTVHKPHAPIGRPFGDVAVTIFRERRCRVVLALGSNLGDRLGALQRAVDELAATPGLDISAVSPVYETAPVGGPEQPDYLNAVVLAEASRPAGELLRRAQEIETAAQRTREVRWGPRTLDIDMIVYGDEVSGDPRLTLPHPRAHERGFVLAPWHDVDPAAGVPGHGTVAGLLAALPRHGVRRRDDVVLHMPAQPGTLETQAENL
jgi:dihydroneopterin aldolase/2-amino-4-hydroxy-6-hydroxymethyldihydropteridine diphosphokinase